MIQATLLPAAPTLETLRERARQGLLAASARNALAAMPGTDGRGQLLRPLIAMSALPDPLHEPEGFWDGVLAVQLAHEASLLHDDVLDNAGTRRGVATVSAEGGVGKALLLGDHLLTASYRAIARTAKLELMTLFARAVERTVAWEGAQARSAGETLDFSRYEEIALGKSGELIGASLATAAVLENHPDAQAIFELGRRVGLLYQMLDDLLDYCPSTDTGKPTLGDFAQRRWTWLLAFAPEVTFDRGSTEVLDILHRGPVEGTPMAAALRRLESFAAELVDESAGLLSSPWILHTVMSAWVDQARAAVAREHRKPPADPPVSSANGDAHQQALTRALRQRVPALSDVSGYLASNGRSFRFASMFFSAGDAGRVARVYAFCRVTDDLADIPIAGFSAGEVLDRWLSMAREAYEGAPVGMELLDGVMRETAAAGVPFTYIEELVEGMRMDLRGDRYDTYTDLRRYTFRVASVVGLWLTRMWGLDHPAVLLRAERLGHAMQITNILRDVGEDWRRGRLYLPHEMMEQHRVSEADLARMCDGSPPTAEYIALLEDLMRRAEADYQAGLEILPTLPTSFARPVAVAAHIYRGIHDEIRVRGYGNLNTRAYTSTRAKVKHSARALWTLSRSPKRDVAEVLNHRPVPESGSA